jgi:hypothetical protein
MVLAVGKVVIVEVALLTVKVTLTGIAGAKLPFPD